MIYIGKGLKATLYEEHEAGDILDVFEKYHQGEVTKENADYFISGVLKDKKRSNDNLLEKDVIALDLDSLPTSTTINDFFEIATNTLKFDFVLYPSFNNNRPKEGVTCPRFRLILPLIEAISKEESYILEHVANHISVMLGVDHDPTDTTWSQHQGLPIDKEQTKINRIGQKLDARMLYRLTKGNIYHLPVSEEPQRKNIIQRFGNIPEEVSDGILYNYIDKYKNNKLQDGTFYLGAITSIAMHTVKGDISEENAIKYARALGIDGSTQDGKLWADENEKALKTRIRRGRSDFSIFKTTQDFWTIFYAHDKYQEVMAGTQQNNSHWLNDLKKTQKEPHAIITNMENLQLILNNDENLKDLLLFNEFTEETVKGKKAPWDNRFQKYWSDTDISELRVYLSSNYGVDFSKEATHDVTLSVARRNSFHPIKDMIHSKPWDGVKRVDNVFIDYLSADNNDYVRAVARKWLSGAVARVYRPGVKFEIVPVLEGKQGRGKSTLISKLGGDFFSDGLPDMKSKDSKEYLRGAWIVELGELSALKKTEIEQVKAFISTTVDRYRPSYGRITVNQERTCVFVGSTNEKGFLKDQTGNRRFYPIPIGYNDQAQKDVFNIEKDTVQQIWAEAYQCYMAGEELFFDEEMEEIAETYRQNATEANALQDDIYNYLEICLPENWGENGYKNQYIQEALSGMHRNNSNLIKRNHVSVKEIMNDVLDLAVADARGRREQKPIQLIMDNHPDWEKSKSAYRDPFTKMVTKGWIRKEK